MVAPILIIIFIFTGNLVIANDYKEGKDFATEQMKGINNMIKEDDAKESVPHFNKDPQEVNLDDGRIKTGVESIKSGNNEVYNYLKDSKETKDKNFANDMKFQEEKWFIKSLENVKESEQKILRNCNDIVIENKTEPEKYKVLVESVEVDKESLDCNERNIIEHTCEKELKLKCQQNGFCNSGGIVLNSIASDMKWEYKDDNFILGTISDNYWSGDCEVYDRNTKFEIRNLDKIQEFRIIEEGFDDYLLVKINNHLVYVGPDGGNQLEIQEKETELVKYKRKHKVVYNGHSTASCERSKSNKINQEIDLKPFLKSGENEIFMRTIVGGGGEAWIKIRAKQLCCNKWIESWEDNCGEVKE